MENNIKEVLKKIVVESCDNGFVVCIYETDGDKKTRHILIDASYLLRCGHFSIHKRKKNKYFFKKDKSATVVSRFDFCINPCYDCNLKTPIKL
jgi:hypothetical protein